jgi:hypothetical protein
MSAEQEAFGMNYAIVIAIAFVAIIAAPVKAADIAAQLNAEELVRIQSGGAPSMAPPAMAPPMTSASGCPPGSRRVPAGYIKRGKWRAAGCVRLR